MRKLLASDALRAWLGAYTTLWAFTLGSAALVRAMPGGAALARHMLRLTLSAVHNPPPTLGGVVSIAANNALHSVWPLLLGVLDAQRRRFARALADGAVLANLAVAALLVGGAIGGYGVRALPFLAHIPLEWAGIATGAAGWALERKRTLRPQERLLGVALTAGILIYAAVVETCLVPHR